MAVYIISSILLYYGPVQGSLDCYKWFIEIHANQMAISVVQGNVHLVGTRPANIRQKRGVLGTDPKNLHLYDEDGGNHRAHVLGPLR